MPAPRGTHLPSRLSFPGRACRADQRRSPLGRPLGYAEPGDLMRPGLTALLAMLALGASASSAATVSCGSGATCGTVSVPLDWGNPSGGRLSIAYELFAHRRSAEPAAGTLVPLAGGPGGSNTAFPNDWQRIYGPLLERFDLLLVDNRGTGQSGAIDCPGLQHQGMTAATVAACAAH